MSKRISDDLLEMMHTQASVALTKMRNRNYKLREAEKPEEIAWVTFDAAMISPVLDELRQRRRHARPTERQGPIARAMAAMNVGDVLIFDPITTAALGSHRKTAQRLMDNPDARWFGRTMTDGKMRVERVRDGIDGRSNSGNPRDPLVERLAAMNLNGRITVPGDWAKRLRKGTKVHARNEMKNPSADWKRETLADGRIRIRRTK